MAWELQLLKLNHEANSLEDIYDEQSIGSKKDIINIFSKYFNTININESGLFIPEISYKIEVDFGYDESIKYIHFRISSDDDYRSARDKLNMIKKETDFTIIDISNESIF